MRPLGVWCFTHRRFVVCGWLAAVVVAVALSQVAGSRYNQSLNLPGTDSQAAINLLDRAFPSASGESDQLVVRTTGREDARSLSVRDAIGTALARVARLPGVVSVVSPYTPAGAGQISRGGTIAFATVNWSKPDAALTNLDAERLIRVATSADRPHLHVSLDGQVIENQESGGVGISVGVGVLAALVVLLVVFGGAVAPAALTLLTAAVALGIGSSLIALLSHAIEVPSVATSLATLIGLGVGVDYGLFVLSRYRSGLASGVSAEDAVGQALNTSGRTVMFAGAIVCVALLGQLALGIDFLTGMSIAAAGTVALTMAAALTLLPAMLGFLGLRALSRRERAALGTASATDVSPFWLRWARLVSAHRATFGLAALAVVVVIALPVLGLRLGNPDAGTDPLGSTSRQAYDALTAGFGPGFNGPLVLAGRAGTPDDSRAFDRLLATAGQLRGVQSVTPATRSASGRALIASVYPTSSPQSVQTETLVDRLRTDVIPMAERGTSLRVHVGGDTATNVDFAKVFSDKLPVFIAIVVVLAFILLAAVFRSLLIPLVAAGMNLLSLAATLGALNAVFNWGWGSSILGLPGTGPISAFLPVLMFSVLFGLSMDYEVYLVGRMQEEWRRLRALSDHTAPDASERATRDNFEAVMIGQAKSGRIVTGAAGIMVLVFGSFLLGDNIAVKTFGFGLAFAVLIDAFVIRTFIVPAAMQMIGPANWAMPAWLQRILPNLSIEGDAAADRAHLGADLVSGEL